MFSRILITSLFFTVAFAPGCDKTKPSAKQPGSSGGQATASESAANLAEARRGFQTKLVKQEAEKQPVPTPPANLFRVVRYDSPAGKLAAYVSVAPRGIKRPAIIWIVGGFGNGIGETSWEEASPDNDQSASAFRKAGIVTMFPALRGGNDNPGFNETFFGEVDDVLAAADFLAKQDGVDPARIYLGGHSTGGTLALLTAAAAPQRFRAVFSFGPVEDPTTYGTEQLAYDVSNPRETELRSPIRWLGKLKSPTFVFEGGRAPGNADSLKLMQSATDNPAVQFFQVDRATHFSIIAPVTRVIAGKITRDTGAVSNIKFTKAELEAAR